MEGESVIVEVKVDKSKKDMERQRGRYTEVGTRMLKVRKERGKNEDTDVE